MRMVPRAHGEHNGPRLCVDRVRQNDNIIRHALAIIIKTVPADASSGGAQEYRGSRSVEPNINLRGGMDVARFWLSLNTAGE